MPISPHSCFQYRLVQIVSRSWDHVYVQKAIIVRATGTDRRDTIGTYAIAAAMRKASMKLMKPNIPIQ